jgi:hypothetical protein
MRPPSKPLPVNQEEFEAAVIASICRNNPRVSAVIVDQMQAARVTDRWGSGAGFFVDYHIADSATRLPENVPMPIDCEGFRIRGVETGQGSGMLFHRDSWITMLECYGLGSGWPEDMYEFEFYQEASN